MKGNGAPGADVSKEILLELYRRMVLTRRAEQTHQDMLNRQEFYLMGHFGTGQEAIGVGMGMALDLTDYLFPTHRGVAEFIGKGMSQADIWAEYMCKPAGPARGKGGLHLSDYKSGLPGLVGSLGSDFAISVGTALSSKIRGSGQVTICSFGEGTSSQSDLGSSLNAAALWKLPLIFAMANNEWCEFGSSSEHVCTPTVAPRAEGYGIPWTLVDGQDVAKVYSVTKGVVNAVRAGAGPYFIEYKTYRGGPHFSGEPGAYMCEEDLCKWRERDPIELCELRLLDDGIATRADLDRMNEEAQAEVRAAIDRAKSLPDVTYEEMLSGVYAADYAGEVK